MNLLEEKINALGIIENPPMLELMKNMFCQRHGHLPALPPSAAMILSLWDEPFSWRSLLGRRGFTSM